MKQIKQIISATAISVFQCSQVLSYTAPRQVAKVMCELYQDSRQRMTVRILDVAAGTGHVGVEVGDLNKTSVCACHLSLLVETRAAGFVTVHSLWKHAKHSCMA